MPVPQALLTFSSSTVALSSLAERSAAVSARTRLENEEERDLALLLPGLMRPPKELEETDARLLAEAEPRALPLPPGDPEVDEVP